MRRPSLLLSLALAGCHAAPAPAPACPGCPPPAAPTIAGCQMLPPNHVFNTRIDALPVHPGSAAFMATIGTHNLHLDLGTTVDPRSSSYYGIPYNVVHANSVSWAAVRYYSADPGLSWDARAESDCAAGADHLLSSPCTAASP